MGQVVSNTLDMKLREDLERLKKIRPTVVCVTTGACACVVSAPRRPAARAAPSVCPRRRARYLRLRCYYDMLPQRAGGTVRAVYAFLASACAVGLQDILTPPDLSLQDGSHRFLFFLS